MSIGPHGRHAAMHTTSPSCLFCIITVFFFSEQLIKRNYI